MSTTSVDSQIISTALSVRRISPFQNITHLITVKLHDDNYLLSYHQMKAFLSSKITYDLSMAPILV